jgi:hypothetical protein
MYEGDSIEKIYATVDKYRAILEGQNAGEPCPSCSSNSGHFAHCALLNRNTAESQSAVDGRITEADTIALHGLGVKW